MNVTCQDDDGCPVLLNAECVFYEGAALPDTGINTNDDLQTVIEKLNTAIAAGGGGSVWGSITGTITDQTDLITYLSTNYTPVSRTLTINGTALDLSANRSWSVGVVTSISAGTGISVGGTAAIPVITNTAPDQTVVLTEGTGIDITGTYPNFTIASTVVSVGVNNEVQTSDGSGGFVASNVFIDESTGSITLGDSSLAGTTRFISVESSGTGDLTLVNKSGIQLRLLGSDTLTAAFTGTGTSLTFSGVSATDAQIISGTYNLNIRAGQGTPVGKDLFLYGGDGATSGDDGGNVYILFGTGNGSGTDGNLGIHATSVNFQSMELGIFINDALTNPTGNPVSGGFLYSDAGDSSKLKWRVPGGTTYDLTSGGGHIIENNGTPLTARANLNFSNGLTASDNNPDTDVKWGGALTANTDITGNFLLNIGTSVSKLSSINILASGIIDIAGGSQTLIECGSGNVDITSASNITFQASTRTIAITDSASTNTILNPFKLRRTSTGTPATGIGVGMEFEVETSASNNEIGAIIEIVTTDVTGGSEDFDLIFKTMSAGATAAERLRITSDGRIYGTALHNNAGAVTGATNQYIASGTYTPTLTGGVNVAGTGAASGEWIRVGNMVTICGRVTFTATAAANTLTRLGISLPIASNFANIDECNGTATGNLTPGGAAWVEADSTNNRMDLVWYAYTTSTIDMIFTATYLII